MLHESAVAKLMATRVEGYSRVKRCSAEGRAVMSLDLGVLRGELEKLRYGGGGGAVLLWWWLHMLFLLLFC